MQPVLTPEEMGAADRRTIAAGTPEAVLMDRAGKAVAWSIRRRLGRAAGLRAVIACGKGNNGGDGLVVDRVLRGWGARVEVVRVGEGVDAGGLGRAVARADVVVDAMYGTGFRGELTGDALLVRDAFAGFAGPLVAIDIPSGVDGLTGAVTGRAVEADWTVSFAAAKPGLCFEPGRSLAGEVEVVDIGIALTADGAEVRTFLTEAADVAAWVPARTASAHKWAAGVFVVGGSGGMTGAPTLASHAAMRAGAGIVWCGVPGADAAARASGTEVITKALAADGAGALTAAAADEVVSGADRVRAGASASGRRTRALRVATRRARRKTPRCVRPTSSRSVSAATRRRRASPRARTARLRRLCCGRRAAARARARSSRGCRSARARAGARAATDRAAHPGRGPT